MRIKVSRTGGFAGIARHGEIDTSGRADGREWEALAESALTGGRDTPPRLFRTASATGSRSVTGRCTARTPG